jgi:hypothetical protein
VVVNSAAASFLASPARAHCCARGCFALWLCVRSVALGPPFDETVGVPGRIRILCKKESAPRGVRTRGRGGICPGQQVWSDLPGEQPYCAVASWGSRCWVRWWSAVRPGVGRFGGVRPSATTPLTRLLVVADSLGGMAVGHLTRVDGGGTVPRFHLHTHLEASKTHARDTSPKPAVRLRRRAQAVRGAFEFGVYIVG